MTKQESFEVASLAFSVMTRVEQGLVLIFFTNTARKDAGKSVITNWIESNFKVAKSLIKVEDDKTI